MRNVERRSPARYLRLPPGRNLHMKYHRLRRSRGGQGAEGGRAQCGRQPGAARRPWRPTAALQAAQGSGRLDGPHNSLSGAPLRRSGGAIHAKRLFRPALRHARQCRALAVLSYPHFILHSSVTSGQGLCSPSLVSTTGWQPPAWLTQAVARVSEMPHDSGMLRILIATGVEVRGGFLDPILPGPLAR